MADQDCHHRRSRSGTPPQTFNKKSAPVQRVKALVEVPLKTVRSPLIQAISSSPFFVKAGVIPSRQAFSMKQASFKALENVYRVGKRSCDR